MATSQPTLSIGIIVVIIIIAVFVLAVAALLICHCHTRVRRARKRPRGTILTSSFTYPNVSLPALPQNQNPSPDVSQAQHQLHNYPRPASPATSDSHITLPSLPNPHEQQPETDQSDESRLPSVPTTNLSFNAPRISPPTSQYDPNFVLPSRSTTAVDETHTPRSA